MAAAAHAVPAACLGVQQQAAAAAMVAVRMKEVAAGVRACAGPPCVASRVRVQRLRLVRLQWLRLRR